MNRKHNVYGDVDYFDQNNFFPHKPRGFMTVVYALNNKGMALYPFRDFSNFWFILSLLEFLSGLIGFRSEKWRP